MELVANCYRLTERLPKTETYGLSSRIQNNASYIPGNIADGHNRGSTAEFLSKLSAAQGNLAHLETNLLLAEMLSFVPMSEIQPMLDQCTEVGKMTYGLMRSLRGGRS